MKLPLRVLVSAGAGASLFVLLAQQQGKQVPTAKTEIRGQMSDVAFKNIQVLKCGTT